MINFKQLQWQTLDKHLRNISFIAQPAKGWISTVRKALNMKTRQLAARMKISQQAIPQLEASERSGSISLNTLRKAAEALDCTLTYAFIPQEGSVAAALRKQAHKKALEMIAPVDHTMMLEAQQTEVVKEKIENIIDDFLENPDSKLWD